MDADTSGENLTANKEHRTGYNTITQLGYATGDLDRDVTLREQFFYLLRLAQALILEYGPYTTFAGTIVFSRAPIARNEQIPVTIEACAMSFAAAQDCTGSAQIEGAAKDDLRLFEDLHDTTTAILDRYLEPGRIQHDTFGWIIIALSSGYIPHTKWHEGSLFLSHKTRLKDALLQLLSLGPNRQQSEVVFDGNRLSVLTKANREVHICANLLLQYFKNEGWRRIRWFHAVEVAEKLLGHLGYVPTA